MEPGIRNTAYELTRYLLILLCIGKNFNLDTVDLTLCGCQAGIQASSCRISDLDLHFYILSHMVLPRFMNYTAPA